MLSVVVVFFLSSFSCFSFCAQIAILSPFDSGKNETKTTQLWLSTIAYIRTYVRTTCNNQQHGMARRKWFIHTYTHTRYDKNIANCKILTLLVAMDWNAEKRAIHYKNRYGVRYVVFKSFIFIGFGLISCIEHAQWNNPIQYLVLYGVLHNFSEKKKSTVISMTMLP